MTDLAFLELVEKAANAAERYVSTEGVKWSKTVDMSELERLRDELDYRMNRARLGLPTEER